MPSSKSQKKAVSHSASHLGEVWGIQHRLQACVIMDEPKHDTYGPGRDPERTSSSLHAGSGIIPSKTSFKAERRLRTKIDLHLVPIVAILYLFCFIDRANLGKHLIVTNGRLP